MFKRLTLILLLFSLLLIPSCTSKKEYVLADKMLESQNIKDNYRTYYEIFIGGFSDSDKDGIGDIKGMIERLDYLNDGQPDSGKSLGVTGIWLMPMMPSPSYHKYDVMDYKAVDKKYGTMEDFETFLKETEKRGINVIIDFVINHTSSRHPWFIEFKKAVANNDTHNKYYNYYSLYKEEDKTPNKRYYPITKEYFYEGNFSSEMPELNLDSPDVRNELKDIMAFWISKGVDGFRLDAAKYPYFDEHEKNILFWNWFMSEARSLKGDIYVVGEVWDSNDVLIPYYESFSNFDFGMSGNGMVTQTVRYIETVDRYVDYLIRYKDRVKAVNKDAILTPFISNHDMDRAAGFLPIDGPMYIASNLYMLTYGTPFIYYGEEIGMKGSRGNTNTDANRRLAMLWGDKDTVSDPIGSTYDAKLQTNGTVKSQLSDKNSLYNHYKKLIMIREAYPEIAIGDYEKLDFSRYQTVGGFISKYNGSEVVVLHNTSDEEVSLDLTNFNLDTYTLMVYAGFNKAKQTGSNLTIGPYTSVILKIV